MAEEQTGNPEQEAKEAGKALSEHHVEQFRREVRDAREILAFALETGLAIEDKIIQEINEAEAASANEAAPPTVALRVNFEKTYRNLAKLLAPVSARTLRATSDSEGRKFLSRIGLRPISEGKIWSRKLWGYTFLVILLILFNENLGEILAQYFPIDEESEAGAVQGSYMVATVFQSLIPFLYGALGALTYLLRSCHKYINERQFDPNRTPEYYNRLLLGIVSGGTISLFVDQISTDTGTIDISEAALGFLAGYNNDFLFNAIERIVNAILPKVGLDTIRRARPDNLAVRPISTEASEDLLKRLVVQLEKTETPEEKERLEKLMDKVLGATGGTDSLRRG